MKEAILGVDAGGTHTRALVRTSDGRTGAGLAGPANWTMLGSERCARAIADAAHLALQAVGLPAHALSRVCVSLAGSYPPWHESEARAAIGAALPMGRGQALPLQVVPDLVAAWAGATGGEAGLVLVAGTGAVAYGRDARGRAARAGGWGPLFGDEGGGYWIGCEALRAVSRALDGRGPETALKWAISGEPRPGVHGSGEESLRAVYRDGWSREKIAALAGAVSGCAASGDAVAAGILERAAGELGDLIAAVAQRLDWRQEPLCVSAVGGVVNAGAPLLDPLERWLAAVCPNARWKAPLGSPLEGAVLLAQEEGDFCRTS